MIEDEREWREAGERHLDVRGLPPPRPLVTILKRIGMLAPGESLVVHLDRDPVLLYPELDEIGWRADPLEPEADEVRLRLRAAR
ncbi:DUF2249 domain-containing protein [Ramlibacter albus]|uniref:DUF2249 domain-containing protein n=1 Tax=Ramlibacter albus TaxID=2079448 RepID=A0A923S546_9BURK|nr:DUF2249 domain-containing protein [Ramlibacter albus]